MGQRILCKPVVLITSLLLFPLCPLSAQTQQAVPQKEKTAAGKTKDAAEAKSAPADASDYAGADTCKTWHEDSYARLRSTL